MLILMLNFFVYQFSIINYILRKKYRSFREFRNPKSSKGDKRFYKKREETFNLASLMKEAK